MHDLIVNLHMHTTYSDGSGTYSELGNAALRTGVDVLIVTDHNILVQGSNQYFRQGKQRVLLLVCEEIHDQGCTPQKNHLLVFRVNKELASLADDTQALISAVKASGGISFIAHPVDPAMPAFGEADISWDNWDVDGYNGIELWNGFSELKSVAKGKWDAVVYAFFPEFIPQGPLPQTLSRWDELTSRGRRVVAIGGSDAHALHMSFGPLHRIIFPYKYHFSTINTHIMTPSPLTGDLAWDSDMVFAALEAGHCYLGYDLPAQTRGFHFSAQGKDSNAIMGDEFAISGSVTLQIKLPNPGEIRLLKNGKPVKVATSQTMIHVTDEPGVYRIEVYKPYLGKLRGWIFSNPIYLK